MAVHVMDSVHSDNYEVSQWNLQWNILWKSMGPETVWLLLFL